MAYSYGIILFEDIPDFAEAESRCNPVQFPGRVAIYTAINYFFYGFCDVWAGLCYWFTASAFFVDSAVRNNPVILIISLSSAAIYSSDNLFISAGGSFSSRESSFRKVFSWTRWLPRAFSHR